MVLEIPIEEQARLAILHEREQRDYQVSVPRVYRASAVAGVPIPPDLRAFVALTTCTESHPHGLKCRWHDWAFCLRGGSFHVILQNDLLRPGMTMKERVLDLFAALQQAEVQGNAHER